MDKFVLQFILLPILLQLSAAGNVIKHTPQRSRGEENARSIDQDDINKVKTTISRIMNWNDIPQEILEWLTILNKYMYILACLPSRKNGHCYQSPEYCSVNDLKFEDQPLKVQFIVQIIIKYRLPKYYPGGQCFWI